MMINERQLICVTSGEPAGIGPEICLDLVDSSYNRDYRLLVIGDINLLKSRALLLNRQIEFNQISDPLHDSFDRQKLNVLHTSCSKHDCLGVPDVNNAAYVLATLDKAIELCKNKVSRIIVTAPINKDIINQAGAKFSGHTEYFAEKFNISKVVMMLSNQILKVALLTTHLPLKEVPAQITAANLEQILTIIHQSFSEYFGISKPKIAVCGLNPHAGENGYLGSEEIEIINPVINSWQQRGYNVTGSYPADTIFNRHAEFDLILAMYHDQGLPIVKFSGFEHGVNTTLGLPIIRTSVDHGTAFNIAYKNENINTESYLNAIKEAVNLSKK